MFMAQKQARGSKSAPARSGFSGKDIVHVILLGIAFTVVFTGIGVGISMLKGGLGTQSSNSEPTLVAVNGTAVPTIPPTATPTEIPCEAQAWWGNISAATAKVIDNVQVLSLTVPPQQIKAQQAEVNNWKSSLDAATSLPPCVEAAQQALESAATETGTLYGLYLSTSEQQSRAKQLLVTMDAYLAVTTELDNLKLTVSENWYTKVRDFKNADCPARRWYIDQFMVRDYQRFFKLLGTIHIQNMNAGELQKTLVDLRTLSGSFRTDMPSYPDCVQKASAHYSTAIDNAIRALNEALNGNMGAVDPLLVVVTSEKTAFETELRQIDPSILDQITLNL
jgi:hypothetical protein